VPSSYITKAVVGPTAGAHAVSVPPSPAKTNAATPDSPFAVTVKPGVPLKTMPVGDAEPFLPPGIVTTGDCGTPSPS
jgi:hypothetical protein